MILRVPEKHLPWLSTYLQGSTLHGDAIVFEKDDKLLRVGLERQEQPRSKASKWLSMIPLVPHPEATCLLSVGNVLSVDYAWRHPLGRMPHFSHTLTEVRLEGDRFVIATDGMTLTAKLSSYEPVELKDTAEPVGKRRLADLFGRVGYDSLTHETERSRVDA